MVVRGSVEVEATRSYTEPARGLGKVARVLPNPRMQPHIRRSRRAVREILARARIGGRCEGFSRARDH